MPKEPDAKYTDGLIPLILVKNGQNQSMVIEVRVFILGVRVSGGPRREPGGGRRGGGSCSVSYVGAAHAGVFTVNMHASGCAFLCVSGVPQSILLFFIF